MDFESLKNTTHADVYKGGNIAGHLKRLDNGLVEFRYTDGYFGPDIATTLPQTEITEPITSAGGSLPPFSADYFPKATASPYYLGQQNLVSMMNSRFFSPSEKTLPETSKLSQQDAHQKTSLPN